jgi:hypothetical protein
MASAKPARFIPIHSKTLVRRDSPPGVKARVWRPQFLRCFEEQQGAALGRIPADALPHWGLARVIDETVKFDNDVVLVK